MSSEKEVIDFLRSHSMSQDRIDAWLNVPTSVLGELSARQYVNKSIENGISESEAWSEILGLEIRCLGMPENQTSTTGEM